MAIVLASGALASTFGGAPVAGREAGRCAVGSGKVLLADGDSVVWKRRGVYRACRNAARTYTLGADDGERGDVLQIALSGRFVAWERVECGKGSTCVGGVIVRDLLRGTRREYAVPDLHLSATDLVVSRAGAAAWIRHGPADRANSYEVRAGDVAGERVLDAGAQVEPRSLAISGRRVYWLSGGTPRTALLDD